MVKVQDREGLATHSGPESCGVARKGDDEALTGGDVSRVLSREILTPRPMVVVLRGATAVRSCEQQHSTGRQRKERRDPARSETPCARPSTSRGNREVPGLAVEDGSTVRAVNPKGARRR